MDTFDRKTRSWIMSRVLSRGTRPEERVRKSLREAGCKFSTRGGGLPGRPDIVIRRIRLAVFVNGCFWHWHGCRRSRMPRDNRQYWRRKIARNVRRDRRSKNALRRAGWHYWTVWECDLEVGLARLLGRIKTLEREAMREGRGAYAADPRGVHKGAAGRSAVVG
jgi:DNA mismatch endonuclease (patch repair protein)